MNYEEILHSPILPARVVPPVEKASVSRIPVLIQGEQGTQKELIAKIIHHTGEWKSYRFYRIDCRILTDEGFTGEIARVLKETNYAAVPATVYLKDVGVLNWKLQMKVLGLIDDRVFTGETDRKIGENLRFLSSSSEDLREKTAKGTFSEDLYFRLNALSIHIPPLRERPADIPAIAHFLLTQHTKAMNLKKKAISDEVISLFQTYWWPANLKELERVLVRSAILSEGETLVEKDLFFEAENEKDSFLSFLKQFEPSSSVPQEKPPGDERNANSLPLFFIELVHRIKNPLVSVKTFTQLLREKFDDVEFRDYFYKIVTEDIEKIDSVLNGLLNYIKISTPLVKANTVHSVVEELLKKVETQLENSNVKIFRRYEKDLPETVVHEEQLRYILGSLIQYAMPSVPPNGSIGVLTKSVQGHAEPRPSGRMSAFQGGYIEVMIVFTGFRKPGEHFGSVLGLQPNPQDRAIELELRLVKEMIQKNKGTMELDVNEKKPRTFISVKLPIERRKIVYYQLANSQ
jgi:signal transduction histidine kinase